MVDSYHDDDSVVLQPMVEGPRKACCSKPIKMARAKFLILMIIGPVITLIIGIFLGMGARPHTYSKQEPKSTGMSTSAVKEFLFKSMKAENIKENLKQLSSEVHISGSNQEENVLVDLLVDDWKKHLDEVKTYSYDVLLSLPNQTDPNYVAVIDPNNKTIDKSNVFEPPLTAYEEEKFKNIHQSTFNAYSASGHVEGDMVFVNYARIQDFDDLNKTLNVDVRGKICIAKYGKLFRGDKAKHAAQNGCIGLVIYSDPADYAGKDDNSTFPNSWWMPRTGVQRGSLTIGEGDRLTPFYPAIKSAYRIPENEANMPRIPVQPISADDAFRYLSKLGGDEAPPDWKGGLNITYRLGGKMAIPYENHRIVLHVANNKPMKEIKNVVGYIWGAVEPDRLVIIGNHRDAWVFGAVDPSSGTATMMEVARALGELVKTGQWRPRRTIMFCSWAAEEYGLIGSTEWTEEFEKKLLLEAVTYLNVDIAVQGTATFRAKATPNLRNLLFNVTKGVANPNANEIAEKRPTVYDTWKKVYYDEDDKDLPYVGYLGSGSDYLMFLQKTGVSSVDFRYTYDEIGMKLSSYPIYHSAHETIEYFEKFLDPEYKFSLAVAQVWTELAVRIADDTIIPFSAIDYASEIKKLVNIIDEQSKELLKKHGIRLDDFHNAVETLIQSAKNLTDTISKANRSSFYEIRRLNDKLMYLDRAFLDFRGLPKKPNERHTIFAPSMFNSYKSGGFSGFTDAVYEAESNGDWENVKKQLSIVTFHLSSAASTLTPF